MSSHALARNVNSQAIRLNLFLELLGEMVHRAVARSEESVPLTLLFASVLRVRQSGRAVQLLTEGGCVEEILSISRTVVEVTVNAAYLQYAAEEDVDRYIQFDPEAVYEELETLNRRKEASVSAVLKRRLRELLRANPAGPVSRNDPTWTARSLPERARLADAASNIPIMLPLVQRCYPKGHAAAHGTVGSLSSFVSALSTPDASQQESRFREMTEALFVINLSVMTLCVYLDDQFRLGLDRHIQAAANAEYNPQPRLQGVAQRRLAG